MSFDEEITETGPIFVEKLPNKFEPKTEPAKLKVKAIGMPMPEIKWYKSGEEIHASDEYTLETYDDGTALLILNEVYPDDAGEIICEATNPVGKCSTRTIMTISEGLYNIKLNYFLILSTFLITVR